MSTPAGTPVNSHKESQLGGTLREGLSGQPLLQEPAGGASPSDALPVPPHHGDGPRPAERQAGPPVVEGPGRYVVYATPDGGWVIARAVGICERCRGCGCGEQGEPVQIPGMVIAIAQQQGKGRLMGMLKAVSGRG